MGIVRRPHRRPRCPPILRGCAPAWLAALLAGCEPPAPLEPPRIEVVEVRSTGCAPREFTFWLRRSGLAGGRYVVRTQVMVDGLRYMDEYASIHENGLTDWTLFDDHSWSGGSGAPWPLPAGRPLRVDLTLGRPAGQVLERQALLFDSCERGRLRFRSALHADGFE